MVLSILSFFGKIGLLQVKDSTMQDFGFPLWFCEKGEELGGGGLEAQQNWLFYHKKKTDTDIVELITDTAQPLH